MLRICAGLATLLFVLAVRPADAQSNWLGGTVRDETGAVLPGVLVQLRQSITKAVVAAVTDASGQYRFDGLDTGRYDLRFTRIDFGRVTKGISVPSNHPLIVDVVLPLAVAADVTVRGHRTFRSLADAARPPDSLIGIANAASEGAVTAAALQSRPLGRAGDVLETVQGLVVSQHSGEGKANQYYLRGFNLDHGTDFAVSVDGVPVNMPSHGHGQGWSDVNFLIPELVSDIQFKKGPYYADQGDFSSAGAANISYLSFLERPFVRLSSGGNGFNRVLLAASPRVGSGHFLAAMEAGQNDGPWENPERYRRLNGVLRYSHGDARQAFTITAMGYNARWTATDQVPQRAIDGGVVGRFGTLDPSDGGNAHRYTVSAEMQRTGTSSMSRLGAYLVDSNLDLFSNFTYYLEDPVHGDQFEQVDRRQVLGGRATHRRRHRWFGRSVEHGFGVQIRHDRINALGLYSTRQRQRIATAREDRVGQTSLAAYYQGQVEFRHGFRAVVGGRGDFFRFGVRSNRVENSGTDTAVLLSPKFGLVVSPARQVELYGNLGYGYHSNDARGVTLAADSRTGEPAAGVPPLVRTRGGEIGIRTILVPRLQTTIAVWGLSLASELVFVGDAGTTEAGRPSRRTGIEWANSYRPRHWLTLDADLSWSSARFTDRAPAGSAIPGTVATVASVGASLHDIHRMSGGLRVRYLGPRPLIESAVIRSRQSTLVNAEVSYRVVPRARVVVDALNLFDSQASDIEYYYRSRLSGEAVEGIDDIHTHPLQPRTLRFGLRLEF